MTTTNEENPMTDYSVPLLARKMADQVAAAGDPVVPMNVLTASARAAGHDPEDVVAAVSLAVKVGWLAPAERGVRRGPWCREPSIARANGVRPEVSPR